ncbi:MAG: hypothetical protein ACT443_01230 [Gemmatimonadota bacterium]
MKKGGVLARTMIAAIAAAFVLSGTVHAQTTTLDEGSFRLTVRGEEVGTETFSIRQNGSGAGAVIIAVGRVVLGTERGAQELSSELQVGGRTLRPAAYEVRVQGTDEERITGRVVGSRFSAQIVSPAGESMREYLAGEGAVLADEGVAHHYYFLARRLEGASARIPVIIPRQSRQVSADVTAAGRESLTIGGEAVAARRITVTPTGGQTRTVWVDAQNRVLKLEIPAAGFVATRTAAP